MLSRATTTRPKASKPDWLLDAKDAAISREDEPVNDEAGDDEEFSGFGNLTRGESEHSTGPTRSSYESVKLSPSSRMTNLKPPPNHSPGPRTPPGQPVKRIKRIGNPQDQFEPGEEALFVGGPFKGKVAVVDKWLPKKARWGLILKNQKAATRTPGRKNKPKKDRKLAARGDSLIKASVNFSTRKSNMHVIRVENNKLVWNAEFIPQMTNIQKIRSVLADGCIYFWDHDASCQMLRIIQNKATVLEHINELADALGVTVIDETRVDIERFEFSHFQGTVATMIGRRDTNEDKHLIHQLSDDMSVFAVFDGHGGSHCSEYCAANLPSLLERTMENADGEEPFTDEAIIGICKELDATFMEQQPYDPNSTQGAGGGSTGVICFVEASKESDEVRLTAANIGDSRACLGHLEGDNGYISMTKDHKPADPLEKMRIEKAGHKVENLYGSPIWRVDGMLAVARAFGDEKYKLHPELPFDQQPVTCLPDVKRVTAKKSDFLYVFCDGLIEVIPESVSLRKMRMGLEGSPNFASMEKVLRETLRSSYAQGCNDNQTAMLVTFRDYSAREIARDDFDSNSDASNLKREMNPFGRSKAGPRKSPRKPFKPSPRKMKRSASVGTDQKHPE